MARKESKRGGAVECCSGMRSDGTCGNGYNVENHNKPCIGAKCPERFSYGGTSLEPMTIKTVGPYTVAGYRERVSEQYRAVCAANVNFFREVVKFGSLLAEVEDYLGNEACRDGSGLKGWLAENCPDVNYNTAYGYKSMAAKVAKMIGGGVQAIACLQGRNTVVEPASQQVVEIAPEFIERRDALFETVDSRRKLEQMWFDFCAERRPSGRPKGSKADLARKPDSTDALAAARAVWSAVIVPADRTQPALASAAKLLSAKDVEDAKIVLQNLMDLLNARERELKPGGGAFKPVKF